MIKIKRDHQCPDYEQELKQCRVRFPTKTDIQNLAKKAKVPLDTLESAIHTAKTGSGRRKRDNSHSVGKGRTAVTQAAAVIIVTLMAAGVATIAKGSIHYQLLVMGVIKQYCGLDFFSRTANDLVAAEIGGRLTCQQIEEHNMRVIVALWSACTGLGLSVAYINSNFWKAVSKVEDVLVQLTTRKKSKTKKKRSASFHTASEGSSPGAHAKASRRTRKKSSSRSTGTSSASSSRSSASSSRSSASPAPSRRKTTGTKKRVKRSSSPRLSPKISPQSALRLLVDAATHDRGKYKEVDFKKIGTQAKKGLMSMQSRKKKKSSSSSSGARTSSEDGSAKLSVKSPAQPSAQPSAKPKAKSGSRRRR